MAVEVLYLQAAGGDTAIPISAIQHRMAWDAAVIGVGISYRTDLAVTQRGAGANFSVDVAAGHAVIAGTSVSYQGKYPLRNNAVANVTIAAAPGSGTRYDLVYAQILDKPSDGGSLYGGKIDKVTGTVDAGLPALPANAIPLAQVGPIISSTGSITNSLITDLRPRAYTAGQAFTRTRVPSGSQSSSGGGVEILWAALQTTVQMVSGRTYKLTVTAAVSCTTGTAVEASVRVRNSKTASAPTTSSTLIAAFTAGADPQRWTYTWSDVYLADTSGPNTLGVSVVRIGGVSAEVALSAALDDGGQAAMLLVEDLGVL
jgi:hypothetical protein